MLYHCRDQHRGRLRVGSGNMGVFRKLRGEEHTVHRDFNDAVCRMQHDRVVDQLEAADRPLLQCAHLDHGRTGGALF